jgi:hypothetical protein
MTKIQASQRRVVWCRSYRTQEIFWCEQLVSTLIGERRNQALCVRAQKKRFSVNNGLPACFCAAPRRKKNGKENRYWNFVENRRVGGGRHYRQWLDRLPNLPAVILDVGAGTRRDVAWLAEKNHDVIAVEPVTAVIREGLRRRPNLSFRWMEDELPSLQKISRLGISFDLILLTSIDEVGDHEGWRIHCCPSPVCRLNSVTWNVVGEVIGDYRDHIPYDDVRRPDHQAVNSLGSSRSSSNEVICSSGLLRRISAPSSSAIE